MQPITADQSTAKHLRQSYRACIRRQCLLASMVRADHLTPTNRDWCTKLLRKQLMSALHLAQCLEARGVQVCR